MVQGVLHALKGLAHAEVRKKHKIFFNRSKIYASHGIIPASQAAVGQDSTGVISNRREGYSADQQC